MIRAVEFLLLGELFTIKASQLFLFGGMGLNAKSLNPNDGTSNQGPLGVSDVDCTSLCTRNVVWDVYL